MMMIWNVIKLVSGDWAFTFKSPRPTSTTESFTSYDRLHEEQLKSWLYHFTSDFTRKISQAGLKYHLYHSIFMKGSIIGYGRFRTKKKKKKRQSAAKHLSSEFCFLGAGFSSADGGDSSWTTFRRTIDRTIWCNWCQNSFHLDMHNGHSRCGLWGEGEGGFQVPTTRPHPAHPRDVSKRVSLKPPRPSTSIRSPYWKGG